MVLIDSLFSVAEPKRRRVLPPANTSTDFHFDDDLDDPIPFTSPSPLKPLSYAKRKKTEEESNSAIWVKPKAPGETTIYSRHIFGLQSHSALLLKFPLLPLVTIAREMIPVLYVNACLSSVQ